MNSDRKHTLFMDIAKRFAQESHCESVKVCALAIKDGHIVQTGINGTPKGSTNCIDHWKEEYLISDFRKTYETSGWFFTKAKNDLEIELYQEWISTKEWKHIHHEWSNTHELHAEQNLIAEAARTGTSLAGCDIYCTLEPCINCAKLLVSLRPSNVYYIEKYIHSGDDTRKLFDSSGIPLIHCPA